MSVFQLDGTCFRFQHPKKVEAAFANGLIEAAAWAKYLEGRKSYMTKHLTLCKNNKMNFCKKCEQKYYVAGNRADSCTKDHTAHEAQYDFTKDPDNVLNCEI